MLRSSLLGSSRASLSVSCARSSSSSVPPLSFSPSPASVAPPRSTSPFTPRERRPPTNAADPSFPLPKASDRPERPNYDPAHFKPAPKPDAPGSQRRFQFVPETDRVRNRKEKELRMWRSVEMFREGKMPREIAEEMEISLGTIRTYFLTLSLSHPDIMAPFVDANWPRIAHGLDGTLSSRSAPTYEDALEEWEESKEKARGKGR